jgi:hypothetical protein
LSPPHKDFELGDPERTGGARLLRDTIAPGTTGDPNDDMSDFPLIRDAGNSAGVCLDDFYAYMPMHS